MAKRIRRSVGPIPKHSFGCTPKKGTKLREILKLTLRPEGATSDELAERGLVTVGSLAQALRALFDDKGWDIRSFPIPPPHRKGRPPVTYKCVGRMRWDGSYRSFVSPSRQR